MTDGPRAGVAGTRLEPLTRARAEELADELLAMTADSDWDDWDRTNLLSDRPGKWDLSLLVTESGVPVAWAVASRTAEGLHLHHIVVSSTRRGSGVGAMVVGELIQRAAPGRLTLKVHPDNVAAARFYERLGFTEGPASPSGYRCYAIDTPPARQTTESTP